MLTSLDQLQANFALVGDKSQYAGSMNQEYLSAVSTTQGATGLAANALSGLNITMGQALLPTVVAVSEKVTEAANVMRHWAQEHPAMTKAIMLFLGVGAGLLVLLGGLALAFGALTAAAAPLGIALGPLLLIVASPPSRRRPIWSTTTGGRSARGSAGSGRASRTWPRARWRF
jgi:hypothetical protein